MKKDLVKVELLEKAEAPGWWEIGAAFGAGVGVGAIIVLT
jgi:hypothetical protein